MTDVHLYHEADEDITGLPAVCMRCGAVADSAQWITFTWLPGRTEALLWFAGELGHIAAHALRERRTVEVPLCNRHCRHFDRRLLWLLSLCGLLLLALGTGFVLYLFTPAAAQDVVAITFAAVVAAAVVLWWVGFRIWRDFEIHATGITKVSITLANVSPRFVAAVAKQDRFTEPQFLVLPDDSDLDPQRG